jgi:hypothetical protein
MLDKMLDIQIVRAINAVGPLTRKQILTRVNENQIDVEASLDALATMGCVRAELSTCFKGDFEYRLAPNFTERECKLHDHRQKVAMYVARHGAESKVVLPVSPGIQFSDGMDRAIWKAANTGRWMMAREIRDILTAVGFRKDDVISRIQYHISAGKWFDRQSGHKNSQFFMLRSDVECPELPGTKKPVLRGYVTPVAMLDDASFESKPTKIVASVVSAQEPATKVSELVAAIVGSADAEHDGYFAISSLGPDALQSALKAVKEIVKEDATLHEAIWAMMDGDEYSYQDLVLLLEPLGFTGKQISPLLSKRFADGLLARRLRLVDGKWINIYKKVAELPEKFTSKKSVISAIVEAQQPTEVEVIAAAQEVQVEEVKPEVFEAKIRIKGVDISLNEFSALYKELSDAGFVRDMFSTINSKPGVRMLKTTHTIKGVEFDRDELNLLTHAMHNTATHFKRALNG